MLPVRVMAGVIFGELSRNYTGVKLFLKERYAYDQYEGFGKWYLVEVNDQFW